MQSYPVTTVLGVYTDFNAIRPDILEAAKLRGNAVHGAAAAYAKGLFVPPLPFDWQGYFDSFRRWFDACVKEVLFVEKRFFDEIFLYDGKPDLGAVLKDDRRVIVDYKTPVAEYPTWKSQIAAYCELAKKTYPPEFEAVSLRLKKDGGAAKATVYDFSQNDYAAFLSALTAYRYFKS
jgi:hypothetical protein